MMNSDLGQLGWSSFYAQHVGDTEKCARVAVVHRDRVDALGPAPISLRLTPRSDPICVGDWVAHDGDYVTQLLPRRSLIERGAVGGVGRQLIAANVDTMAVVTSCNADFNVARLERYLALAHSAGCLPLIILTKSDLGEAAPLLRQAERLGPLVTAIALNAKTEAERLAPWCKDGQTMALVGSSGVGKTTLLNGLTGGEELTAGIREDDAKGRHTTTARYLRPTHYGGWLIDTPGVRELRLAGADVGVAEVFRDIEDLALACKFRNCSHETEPGCAVQAAIRAGDLDADRLQRWRKLAREVAHETEPLHETRARNKAFGKLGKAAAKAKRDRHR